MYCKDIDCIRLLLKRGASVDLIDAWGRTVTHYLCNTGDHPRSSCETIHVLVQILISAGITDFDESESETPWCSNLFSIYRDCLAETAEILIQHGAMSGRHGRRLRSAALNCAASWGNTAVFKVLLRDKHDIDLFPALITAVENDQADVLDILIEQGVDLIRFHNGSCLSALHETATVGPRKGRCMKILLGNGADPNLCTNDGDTPMHYAAKHGSIRCMQLLLEYGAKLEVKNKRGETPVHKSVERAQLFGEKPLVWLIDNGANFLDQDHQGYSILHVLAAQVYRFQRYPTYHSTFRHCLEVILSRGADPREPFPMVRDLRRFDILDFYKQRVIRETFSTLRNEDILATNRKALNVYFRCLETYYPGSFLIVDDEIYWDAEEQLTVLSHRVW